MSQTRQLPKTEYNKKDGKRDRVQIVKNFLNKYYEIKMNVFDPDKSHIICKDPNRYITTPTPADISLHMESENIRGMDSILKKILYSPNQVKTFNPIQDYLNSLEGKWKGESHIEKLCSFITARDFGNFPEGYYQDRFSRIFKKWMVACVANYLGDHPNDVIFGFISAEGGIGKTRFFEFLVPEQLKLYYLQSDKEDKYFDMNKAFTQNFLISFEELEGIKRSNIETLKKILSSQKLSIKKYFTEQLQRISNAVFTSNKSAERGGFMYDGMNDRRFAIVEIEAINYIGYNNSVNVDQLWAEALVLYKSADFNYIWNKEDWCDFLDYNARYEKETPALKLIKEYYRLPETPEDEELKVFKQPIEILQDLRKHRKIPASVTNVSDITIGMALKRVGYERVMKKPDKINPRYGYYVVPLFGEEKKSNIDTSLNVDPEEQNDIKEIELLQKSELVLGDTLWYAGDIALEFKPVKTIKNNHCNHCFLMRYPNDCIGAPCGMKPDHARRDGQIGVFTIQQMPKHKEQVIDELDLAIEYMLDEIKNKTYEKDDS